MRARQILHLPLAAVAFALVPPMIPLALAFKFYLKLLDYLIPVYTGRRR